MKFLINKSPAFNRIEFWAVTTLFVFIIFFFITDALDGSAFNNTPYKSYFDTAKVPFHFYENYFIPQLIRYVSLFLAFFYLNFILIPKLLRKEALMRNIILVILVFLFAGIVFGVTDTYLREYLYASAKRREEIDQMIFQDSFEYTLTLLSVLFIYTIIKYAGLHLLSVSEALQSRYRFIRREGIVACIIWATGLLILTIGQAERDIIIAWSIIIPSGIALYLAGFFRFIPRSLSSKYPFASYVSKNLVVLAIGFPVLLIILTIVINDELAFSFSFFNTVFQLFITVPITWALFKRQIKGNEEIYVLKKELGKSAANLDFLRSQINPHFLFNALNTIYGTAIQEKAERTSEGIEKLGDMMRFMLQENMQEKISLAREIDYLNNYIGLQKLRTDGNPAVEIQTEIQDRENLLQIAPMLLIPFVENAFKHGISFRKPSHIKVTLEIKDNSLYLDVYNSKHTRQENDPEKDKSGIGLENVKQRLNLLYPNRHELITRDTTKEFFIHLTIKLAEPF